MEITVADLVLWAVQTGQGAKDPEAFKAALHAASPTKAKLFMELTLMQLLNNLTIADMFVIAFLTK